MLELFIRPSKASRLVSNLPSFISYPAVRLGINIRECGSSSVKSVKRAFDLFAAKCSDKLRSDSPDCSSAESLRMLTSRESSVRILRIMCALRFLMFV